MKKLKLLILCLLSIFCLSSCLTTGFFLGSILDEYGPSGGGPDGIKKLYYKDKPRFKEYMNSLKNREKYVLKVSDTSFIKMPKNIVTKKYENTLFLYDKENKMMSLGISLNYSSNSEQFENYDKNKDILKDFGKVKIVSGYGNKYIVSKVSNIYIDARYDPSPNLKEYYDLIIDFINNIEEVK